MQKTRGPVFLEVRGGPYQATVQTRFGVCGNRGQGGQEKVIRGFIEGPAGAGRTFPAGPARRRRPLSLQPGPATGRDGQACPGGPSRGSLSSHTQSRPSHTQWQCACGHFTWPGGHGSPVPLMETLNLSFYASADLDFLIFEMGVMHVWQFVIGSRCNYLSAWSITGAR